MNWCTEASHNADIAELQACKNQMNVLLLDRMLHDKWTETFLTFLFSALRHSFCHCACRSWRALSNASVSCFKGWESTKEESRALVDGGYDANINLGMLHSCASDTDRFTWDSSQDHNPIANLTALFLKLERSSDMHLEARCLFVQFKTYLHDTFWHFQGIVLNTVPAGGDILHRYMEDTEID